ncbi:Murein DD-endopeptidase MepM and murein hydrolase activator NlpD, contain LysM domain [Duganella sp. CF402]|uniref:M23 family metallopeptidase n=1 Tax=unclassified Duganella TaxID=2636909 RepID=UPI0008CCE4EB|nr:MULTISPECIES: M23 family metallopeptidase [unclassified Duganella]RZT03897.1 murein DD-endopeptidase MepM/ murein hydrolase activator NlpD [Duganella sp. BK701]SEM55803.1 Murein DD-endopeptidase MepM and murein hydrolase activator NlpD, contain LysM domain [Duganella sp. CF402]
MNQIHKFTSSRLFSLLGSTRKARIISASALFLAVCAFGAAGVAPLAPDASDLPVKTVQESVVAPDLAPQINALEQQSSTAQFVHEEKIRAGDTLATLLTRLGVDDDAAENFIKKDKVAKGVMQLKTGKRVQAQTDDEGNLQWLRATVVDGKDDPVTNIKITRKGDGFVATAEPAKLERRVEMHARTIRSGSLYAATDSSEDGAKLPDTIVKQIIEMFSTNIDFRGDLKRGDTFNVVYETFWQDGEFVRAGRVLAGEFTNKGTTYQSVWFEDPQSKQGGGYYSFDGKSLKKAFLKSPVEFSRISSGFAMRVHPISGQWKAHKGIDFPAPTGTPIRAAGDGVIDFAGTMNGYGNFIIIKHWNNYTTAYAHMSRFGNGMKKGAKVSQGDVIGYVGTTGWSTGAHLHYEFRVGGEAKDPSKMNVQAQAPLTAAEMSRFKVYANDMMHRFALLRPAGGGGAPTRVAAK